MTWIFGNMKDNRALTSEPCTCGHVALSKHNLDRTELLFPALLTRTSQAHIYLFTAIGFVLLLSVSVA